MAMKRLNFGGSGKMEYVFGTALALIILAALVLTIRSVWWENTPDSRLPEVFHYKCIACKAEMTIRPEDVKYEEVPNLPSGMIPNMMNARPKCPKCGKSALASERKCPKCGTYSIPEWMLKLPAIMPGAGVKDVCPSCGEDMTSVWRVPVRPPPEAPAGLPTKIQGPPS
jgi:predicted RNA-binding Zn-ribbon protein involved in translation (DUF1610 family)